MQYVMIGAVAAWLQVLPVTAAAHHSHGNYSLMEYTHLQGEVKELLWLNPHVWIHLEVTDDSGEPSLWALEGGSIIALTRRGWSRDDIQPGDSISVRCHQLKDGSQGCLLGYVMPEGGVEKEFD